MAHVFVPNLHFSEVKTNWLVSEPMNTMYPLVIGTNKGIRYIFGSSNMYEVPWYDLETKFQEFQYETNFKLENLLKEINWLKERILKKEIKLFFHQMLGDSNMFDLLKEFVAWGS